MRVGIQPVADSDKDKEILAGKYDESRILAHLCDVIHYDPVEGLWNTARTKFGSVDIWINNAGTVILKPSWGLFLH